MQAGRTKGCQRVSSLVVRPHFGLYSKLDQGCAGKVTKLASWRPVIIDRLRKVLFGPLLDGGW